MGRRGDAGCVMRDARLPLKLCINVKKPGLSEKITTISAAFSLSKLRINVVETEFS